MNDNRPNENKAWRDRVIPAGKFPPELLIKLLELPKREHEAVIVGPNPGEDAAILKWPREMITVTSDPITFVTPKPGYYAIHVNANDLAAMGAAPGFFTLTMIMPPGSTWGRAEEIMTDALAAADGIGAVLIGGHSEVSEAVNSPVLSVTMFGELIASQPLCSSRGKSGDAVIQVNPMAVEGASILAGEHYEDLIREFGSALVEKAVGFLEDPGLSVVEPALTAARFLPVHAMHDPTEGGLATGLREIAQASDKGLEIWEDRLILAEETEKICSFLDYNPLGLISSGCLLFTIPAEEAGRAASLLKETGRQVSEIGYLTDKPGQYDFIGKDGIKGELPYFEVDELAKG